MNILLSKTADWAQVWSWKGGQMHGSEEDVTWAFTQCLLLTTQCNRKLRDHVTSPAHLLTESLPGRPEVLTVGGHWWGVEELLVRGEGGQGVKDTLHLRLVSLNVCWETLWRMRRKEGKERGVISLLTCRRSPDVPVRCSSVLPQCPHSRPAVSGPLVSPLPPLSTSSHPHTLPTTHTHPSPPQTTLVCS